MLRGPAVAQSLLLVNCWSFGGAESGLVLGRGTRNLEQGTLRLRWSVELGVWQHESINPVVAYNTEYIVCQAKRSPISPRYLNETASGFWTPEACAATPTTILSAHTHVVCWLTLQSPLSPWSGTVRCQRVCFPKDRVSLWTTSPTRTLSFATLSTV